jgi:glycosyltransferase involved in cell wall biosynthesis
MPYETWLRPAWQAVQRIMRDDPPDAICTTSPPGCIHYLGYLAKKRYGLPWITCFRDPWITNAITPVRSPFFNALEARAERAALRTADRIILNTPNTLRAFAAAHPDYADKMAVLTNGFDPEIFAPHSRSPRVDREQLTLLHAGELYMGRNPKALLEALKDLHTSSVEGVPKLRLTQLGRDTDGLARNSINADPGLAQVLELRPHAPYLQAVESMSQADILLLIPFPGTTANIPAKLYEYLGAGRPVLVLTAPGGDVEWVLRTAGVTHRVARPDDREGIKRALLELAHEIRAGRDQPSDTSKVKVFTREHIARELASQLDACCSGHLQKPRYAQAAE